MSRGEVSIRIRPSWLISGASIEASSRDNLEAAGNILGIHKRSAIVAMVFQGLVKRPTQLPSDSGRLKLREGNTKSDLATSARFSNLCMHAVHEPSLRILETHSSAFKLELRRP